MTTINVDKTYSVSLPTTSQNHHGTSLLSDRNINKILMRKLGGDGNLRLVDWRLEVFGEGKGFLGQYYHLHITVRVDDNTKTLRFFVKTPPPPESPQFDFLLRYDTFNKEIIGYTDLARRMGVGKSLGFMVECYHCERDIIIVMEDATMSGYATPNKHVPFDEEQCILLLKTVSRLHSKSLILDERLRREGRSILDLYGHLMNEIMFAEDERSGRFVASNITGVCTLLDFIEGLADSEKAVVKRRITEWSRKLSRLLGPSSKYRNVICHRDLWGNNIMFRRDPSGNLNGCYLIDFQFYTYCPPAIDFTFCLYLTTDQATRDRHFDSFARIYHDSFAQFLAEDGFDVQDYLPWAMFWDSCVEARNVAIVYSVMCLQIMLLSSNTTIEYFSDATDRLEDIIYGDGRSDLVLYQSEKLPSYKERLLEIVHEIKDRLPDYPPMNV